MVALIWLILGCGLLWAWLVGHWFARVLVFLLLLGVFMLVVSGLFNAMSVHVQPDASPLVIVGGLAGILLAGLMAWLISGLPIYRRRRQERA